ncbi:MAG: MEKHLA domain-containing protein [Nitrospira sp. SCN 59-13]|nr:MAG: MEKHLA domain-containing protein [Nitrospira sp. SCN 59-13]
MQVWQRPEVVEWSQWLLDSYRHCVGRELMERVGGGEAQAQALFTAPMVVVSHGTQDDPILNYGSQLALTLWEMTWEQLVQTPSRLTAEPVNRTERESMLERARVQGYIDNYRGIRISNSGRRFLIEHAIVWNVVDRAGYRQGQAATFSRWTFL